MRMESIGAYRLEIEFILRPGKRREFSRSFEDLIRHEGEGHIKTNVYEDRDEPGHLLWIATWNRRDSLDAYVSSDEFGVLIGGLKTLSSQTQCRLVGDLDAPGAGRRLHSERVPRLVQSSRVDLSRFEGAKP